MKSPPTKSPDLHDHYTVTNKMDVLLWAGIAPIKFGSFEDFLLRLCINSRKKGIGIKCVLLEPACPRVLETFDKNSIDYELLPVTKHSSPLKLLTYLVKYRPTSFYLHFYGFGSPLILCARMFSAAKIVFHDHNSLELTDSEQEKSNSRMLEYLLAIKRNVFSSCVKNYLVVSEFIKSSYKTRNPLARRRTCVIHNGVDLDRFRPPIDEAEKLQLRWDVLERRDNIPVVTFVGSVDERKGVDIFLEVASDYSRRRMPAYFVIVGDGEMKDLVRHSVRESATDNLVYLGLRSDVENVLKASDIFLAPYRWGEAFGLTLIEAGACGLPVVANDVGAIPEVLGSGEGSVCVPTGDTEAVINELDKLISDPQLRLQRGALARKRVERLFDINKTVENTVSFFER